MDVYNELKDKDGNTIHGRTKLFITKYNDEGDIVEFFNGLSIIPETTGMLFIVDEWLITQLDKVQFIDNQLKVKDGKELIPPVKTEKELQREALLKQLAELDSQPSE